MPGIGVVSFILFMPSIETTRKGGRACSANLQGCTTSCILSSPSGTSFRLCWFRQAIGSSSCPSGLGLIGSSSGSVTDLDQLQGMGLVPHRLYGQLMRGL